MSKRDVKDLLARARDAGAEVEIDGSGHWRVRAPSGEVVTLSRTPSDVRAVANAKAALRRVGLLERPPPLSACERAWLDQVMAGAPWRGTLPRCSDRLRRRGLVRVSARRGHWVAWLTETGREALDA